MDMKIGGKNSMYTSVIAFLGYIDPYADKQRHKASNTTHYIHYDRASAQKTKKINISRRILLLTQLAATIFLLPILIAITIFEPPVFLPAPATLIPIPAYYS